MESEDIIQAVDSLASAAGTIATAITFSGVPGTDAYGGGVASLTEAVMGVTGGLCRIADAIHELADAVRDTGGTVSDAMEQE